MDTRVEERLIRDAQGGDHRAFAELVQLHRQLVTRLVFRLLGHAPDVEDVVQDVFVHVYRSIGRFRGEARFTTWLHRLTVNVVRMHLRRGRSRPKLVYKEAAMANDGEERLGPDELLSRNRRVRALYRLLDRLSEKKRMVLVLHDFEGMTPKQIAELIDVPVITVRTRLFYARKELYEAIAADPELGALVSAALRAQLPGKPEDGGEP
jgi:RNA polymerase sigma-70 factor (ECF subfamily)